MKHKVKKIKFKQGKDANKMLMKKLAVNFLNIGYLTTTKAKAKALKNYLEKLLTKSKKETEANKKYLLKKIGQPNLVYRMFKKVGPSLKDRSGGYLKLTFLGQRLSDGSEMAKIEWSLPILKNN